MLMNRNRFWLILLTMFVMVFAACNDEDENAIIDEGGNGGSAVDDELYCKLLNNQDVNKAGGKFFWAVEANRKWTLDEELLPDWLSIDPLQGKAGTTNVVLDFAELEEEDARTFDLPFAFGDDLVNITVKQVPEGGVEEEESVCRFTERLVFGKNGGTLECILQTSEDWTMSVGTDWLTVSPLSGQAGQTTLTLTAGASGGIVRIGVLTVNMGGEQIDLTMSQGLNDTYPTVTMEKDATVSANEATLYATCAFENDETAVTEVGFLYREKGTGDDSWTKITSTSAIVNGTFEFSVAGKFAWGKTFEYKPYATLDEKDYEGETNEFTIERRVIENGVWFYENFDALYDAETGEYAPGASQGNGTSPDRFNTLEAFDAKGGLLRLNQPNARYRVTNPSGGAPGYRISIKGGNGYGATSAAIQPNGVSNGLPANTPAGIRLYEDASGNWRITSNWNKDVIFEVTNLDFSEAGELRLSFGCYQKNNNASLKDGSLKVFVSTDNETWTEVPFTYGEQSYPNVKWWKPVIVDGLDEHVTGIRIMMNAGGKESADSMCLDDIKVTEKP